MSPLAVFCLFCASLACFAGPVLAQVTGNYEDHSGDQGYSGYGETGSPAYYNPEDHSGDYSGYGGETGSASYYNPDSSGDYGYGSGSGDAMTGTGVYYEPMYYGLDPNGTCSISQCQNSAACCEAPEGDWYCYCFLGYEEPDCSYFSDPCMSEENPCMNEGTCHFDSYNHQAYCECPPGFTGRACEFSMPIDCTSDECQNGGTCIMDSWEGPYCSCPDGFSGSVCEFVIGQCEEDTCVNGHCVGWICAGYYACNCDEGYHGTFCEIPDDGQYNDGEGPTGSEDSAADACSSSTCPDGVSCCVDPEGSWYCDCPLGYYGPTCADYTDPCAGNNPCQHGGNCTAPYSFSADAYCSCPRGFTGKWCETTVPTNCTLDECQNGAACVTDPWGSDDVWCDCPEGFTGPYCEFAVGECEEDSCERGSCYSTDCDRYSYMCHCDEGYSGTFCEVEGDGGNNGPTGSGDYGPGDGQYNDTGPCSSSPCENGASCCEDPEGGWYCDCPLGFDPPTCAYFTNPCVDENPCMEGGTCVFDPTMPDYAYCQCPPGFTGKVCETTVPTDCTLDQCQNGGACVTDSWGGNYVWCECPEGFTGPYCEFAVGECQEDSCERGSCYPAACGGYSYMCHCDEGYTGTFCEVEDDGQHSGDYGPPGSGDYGPYGSGDYGPSGSGDYGPYGSGDYGPSGSGDYGPGGPGEYLMYYGLDPNGTCNNSPCQNSAGCCEAPEGDWYCYCLLGYEEPGCTDFSDPCNSASGENPCMNEGTCYFDSYSNQAYCQCPPGFTGRACEFSMPTDCNSDECQNGGTCHPESWGDPWCSCPDGFSGPVCEFAIGQCEEDTCMNGHCVEWICAGYYACNCDEGYSGTFCEYDNADDQSSGSGDYGPGDGHYNDTDGCSSSPCENGASCCEEPDGGWYCDCPLGFHGPTCALFTNPCVDENPCMEGGTCVPPDSFSPDYAYCLCPRGFTGKVCETTVPTDCTLGECQNGGACVTDSWGGNDVWCECLEGFTGPYCEFAVGECQEDSCEHGSCYPADCEGYTYMCHCEEGYTGTFCEVEGDGQHSGDYGPTGSGDYGPYGSGDYGPSGSGDYGPGDGHYNDTDGCSSSPCENGASCCEDPEGGWYCDCPLGFDPPTCATFTNPCVDENPCMEGGTCVPPDSFSPDYAYCLCPRGFTGKVCETTVPTDCTLGECQNEAACVTDSWGGNDVWCECLEGFTGPYCEFAVGECQEDSCEHGSCYPADCGGYSYMCHCEEGYTGTFCEVEDDGQHSGDYGPTGSGDYGPPGSGDYGPYGSGDYGPTGSGDHGPYGSGDYGPSGSGDYGPGGPGEYLMYYGLDPNGTCSNSPCQNSAGCCEAPEGDWYCYCLLGYEEPGCTDFSDPCNSASGENPCMNEGTCYFDSYSNQAYCQCPPGFTGRACEFPMPTDCTSDECQNGGTCRPESWGDAWCSCPDGFSGPVCEFAIGQCEEDTCVNGDCVGWICAGYYACNCEEGYTGTFCEVEGDGQHSGDYGPTGSGDYGASGSGDYGPYGSGDYGPSGSGDYGPGDGHYNDTDGCSSSPCENGASCCEDPDGSWYCDCPLGFHGPTCALFTNPCVDENPCMEGGTCVFDPTMPDYGYCQCPPGFTGKVCETTVPTDCTLDQCQNGGACVTDSWGGNYVWCECPEGFTGPYCEFAVGECQEDSCEHGSCYPADCGGYSYMCHCEEGYTGTFCEVEGDGQHSGDYGPSGSGDYGPYGSGDYGPSGSGDYGPGDGHYNDTDGCSSSPCENGASCCEDPEGGWYCDCPLGFDPPTCAYFNNPCVDENPCMEGGTCVPPDSFSPDYAYCLCPRGFTGKVCETTVPTDCTLDQCQNGGVCVTDSWGGSDVWCDCPEGFTGPYCEFAVGECQEDSCEHGSCYPADCEGYTYMCHCEEGYTGTFCEVEGEGQHSGDYGPTGSGDYGASGSGDYGPGDYAVYYGLDPNGTCSNSPCQNSAGCCEAPEGDWYCYCLLGYEEPDCTDFSDPCNSASEENPCMNEGTCHFDSYSNQAYCQCQPGFTGRACEFPMPIDCTSDECQNGGTCIMESWGDPWCSCPDGFSGPVCEFAIGQCEDDTCVNGDCVEWICAGYYACNCDEGYSGTFCEVEGDGSDYGPNGSGDYGPTGSGDYGPSGSGDYGPTGSGDYGPTGSGDYGPTGSGDYGPTGSGDYGLHGSGDYGPTGSGDYGLHGSGDYGPTGSGDNGPYYPSEGPGPYPSESPGPYYPSEGPGPYPSESPGPYYPSEGPGPYPSESPGPYYPSEGPGPYPSESPGPYYPSEGPGPYPSESPGPHYPSEGPGPYPSEGPGPYPSEGPGPYPSEGPGPYPSESPGPYYPSEGPGPYPSESPGPYYPSEGPGPYPSEGPGPYYPSEVPGPYPSESPGPYYPSEGPGPYPSEGPGPYPSEGPGPYPSEGPGPYNPSEGPGPYPSENPGPYNPTEGPGPYTTEVPGPNPLEDSNLYPFGPDAGDLEYEDLLNSGDGHYWGECLEQSINDEGFPFYGKRHYKLYVCDNGMISFETPWAPWVPYLFGSRRMYSDIAMIAPFWAMSDASSLSQDRQGTEHSHVYFHSYAEGDGQANTEEILNRAGDDANDYDTSIPDFRPTWALVVTWVRLPPYIGCSCYRGWGCQECDLSAVQTNTFQAVLMTNALHSFGKSIYPQGGLNWVYPGFSEEHYQYFTDVQDLPWPVAGFSAGDQGQNVINLPTYSGTQRMHLLDEVEGNTGYVGQWMVRMEDSDGTMDARLECLAWHRDQPDPADVQATLSELPPDCPCTEWQLWFDGAFQIDWSSWGWDICAYSAFPTADGLVQKCCYEDGALKTGGPDGGYVTQNREDDELAYTKCCVESVGTCDLFYEKRPSANCSQYLPPIWSWTWGDPHITTLDGKRYTFNGKGEYVMADVDSGQYQLQARTAFPEGTNTATAFSAMVIQKMGGVPIQVNIASDSETGMTLYIDGTLQDMTIYGNVSSTIAQESNVLVSRPSANEFKVYYSTGVSATAQVEQGMMSIVFSAPESFKGQTKGLLGVWDDDQANDFTMYDGTVLSSDSTERQIFDFGRSWQVLPVTSLFHYDAGQSVDTFQDDTFVPTFGDEVENADPVLLQQAQDQCGDNQECLYDVLQTGDVAVGEASLHQSTTIEDGSQKSSNYPPTVTGPTVLYVVYQETLQFSLTAEDRNMDSISFSISSPSTLAASVLSSGGNTATFSWQVDRREMFNLKILVTDAGGASALYWPTVYLCSCENGGSCATSGGAQSSSNNTRFVMQECTCAAGYTGSNCESDIDACAANYQPCYAGVRCIDLPAPANISGYQCDSCPTGYSGNGQRCSDVDECASGSSCAQLCVNFPGSYQCSCNAGYELGGDGSSCNDVDECTPASDCDQVCNNNEGSYSCSCNSGFELGSDGKSCSPTDPCPVGDTGGCDVVNGWCLNNGGAKQCACKSGYALADDGVTCNDVNECQTGENNCNQNCGNTEGSYTCSCEAGYQLVDEHTCQDIDECNTGNYNCTGNTVCKNQPGSYSCDCAAGLVLTDGECVDLPDDEKPVSVSTRTSSDQDLSNTVTFNCGMSLAQYTVTVDNAFSALLAAMATEHCTTNAVECGVITSDGSRRRRRSTPVTFSVLEVQRPSGYPSANNDSTIALAYYLLLPSGNTSIPGSELLAILQSNVSALEAVLGANISSIALLVPVEEEEPVAATGGNTVVIVVAVLVPLVLLAVAIAVAVYMYKKSRSQKVGLSSEDVRMEPMRKERVSTRAWGPLGKGGATAAKPPPTWAEQATVGIGSQPVRAPLPPVRAPTFVREGTQGSIATLPPTRAPTFVREGTQGSIANPAYQSTGDLKGETEPKVNILQLLPSRLPAPPTESELYPKPPGTPEAPEEEASASLLETQEL
ncbi:uncharacterized protein LOC144882991 [Branchiostoma floridae x Branchiostoma japonicum]